ncbi:MAG: HAMP domain-containing protein, partial [Nitrospirae bacterium]
HHPDFHTARFGGELYRFVLYPLPGPLGLGGAIVVGAPLRPVTALLPRIFQLSLWAGLASALLAGLLGWLLARSVVAPVEEIALTARQIGEHNLAVRMPAMAGNDELARLTASLNAMLDRLARSLELQRRFLSDASHEIRTPITILKGNLEVTLRRPRSAEAYRDCLLTLKEEVDHLERLAEQLLWLARADAAGLELAREAVALDGWVAQVAERHRPAVEAAGRRLELALASEATVELDPARMQQCLDNLLANARRFTPERGAVRVATRRLGPAVEIAVEDEGPGVPEAEREAVFHRFFRGDDARNRAHGGSGLGLAIAREIARAHGGDLWVETAASGGARFVVRLPA